MDVHVHRTPHFGLNDHQPEDDLQFLSLEERECILFFEETIGSLEEDLENDGKRISAQRNVPAEMRPASYERDHDIIDLVHTTPDLKHTNIMPDFQKLVVPPETHFEMKPQREPNINFPPHFNISLPSEEGGHQPPPGSIPTPVIIASKIAEQQGASSTSASPSALLQHRRSLELPQNAVTKHGPPIHAKPTHLPNNISLLLGSRENIPHSIAAEAVSVQEKRAQMLANLSSSEHPLDGGEPSCVRNLPMRSVSFRQPTPEQSRLEALSKFGLAQRRAQSLMQPSTGYLNQDSSSTKAALRSNSSAAYPSRHTNESSVANLAINQNNGSQQTTPKIHGTDTIDCALTPSNPDREDMSSVSPGLTSAEIRHSDFNSYGGKSIILNPTTSIKSNHNASPASSPKPDTPEVQLNSFGGWSRVMNPSVPHREEPSSAFSTYNQSPPNTPHINPLNTTPISPPNTPHIGPLDTTPISPPNTPLFGPLNTTPTSPLNNYGARSKTFSQVNEEDPKSPSKPAASRPPPRHSGPLSPTKPRSPPSPELRRKPTAKPSFRTQGVTVQFSGKGTTNEARRDALRKLGLLRGNP